MSLKAKIEAVIYACEEPVTLAQLVGLLGDEAQAELDRSVSAQQTLSLNELEAAEADPALGPEFDADNAGPVAEAGPPAAPDSPDSPGNSDADEASGVAATGPNPQTAEQTGSAADLAADSSAVDAAASAATAAAARTERSRLARLRAHFRILLDQLIAEYASPERGLEIREVAGGFRFATKPEYHDTVRGFVKTLKPPLKLTLQSLETLAVVAYKQPVTAPEISEIRGVDSSAVLGSLLARKLIATAGRKHVIGRPILYKTTREFLLKFGLKDVLRASLYRGVREDGRPVGRAGGNGDGARAVCAARASRRARATRAGAGGRCVRPIGGLGRYSKRRGLVSLFHLTRHCETAMEGAPGMGLWAGHPPLSTNQLDGECFCVYSTTAAQFIPNVLRRKSALPARRMRVYCFPGEHTVVALRFYL